MMDNLASITGEGAILMGKLFCVDGHDYTRKYFAFSHMHIDHSKKIQKCLYNGKVFMTKPTRDLLEAINNDNYGSDVENQIKRTQIITLNEDDGRIIHDSGTSEKITFYSSEHVLGASQIEIVTKNEEKILYSGDVGTGDQPPNKVHTLILDSTHGHPRYRKHFEPESLERRLLDRTEEAIGKGRPVVIHAHRGKIQEAMSLLSQYDPLNDLKFYASNTNIRVAEIYRKYKISIKEEIHDAYSREGKSSQSNDFPYIQFETVFTPTAHEELGKAYSIYLVDDPNQFKETANSFTIPTTAHTDFDGLIEYVKKSEAQKIIVDNSRTKQANILVEKLKEQKFDAVAQPAW